jgi:hypothetical protein
LSGTAQVPALEADAAAFAERNAALAALIPSLKKAHKGCRAAGGASGGASGNEPPPAAPKPELNIGFALFNILGNLSGEDTGNERGPLGNA